MEEIATASSSSEPQRDYLEKLEEYFGHRSFRPKQLDIIRSIIEDRKKNCVVMATGYGKSLLYQYPSIFLKGLTIVITPMISLMQDQVQSLNSRNIESTYLGTGQPDDVITNILAGKYRIVYLTPQYLMGEKGPNPRPNLLAQVYKQLKLIAIDEAHCLSEWGHEFYEGYSELEETLNDPILSDVPILAVSAVANSRVREDIVTKLRIPNTQIWCTGFDRPNLTFRVKKMDSDAWEDLKELLNQNNMSSIIIYCLNHQKVNEIAKLLEEKNIPCGSYHSYINQEMRRNVQQNFMKNHVKIIVCTVAFGMGIDKPDVRLVIHYGVPMEFETYYMQVGLAGRDGIQSQCVMFWKEENFNTHKKIRRLDTLLQDSERYLKLSQIHERQSETLSDYIHTKDCRRKFILQYFEDNNALNLPDQTINPRCCDNCEVLGNLH